MNTLEQIKFEIIELCSRLISIPSTSGNEHDVMQFVLTWAKNLRFLPMLITNGSTENFLFSAGNGHGPTLILTTHLDTVIPSPEKWTVTNPFTPKVKGDQLYGLGANDATGIATAMMLAAKHFATSAVAKNGRILVVLVSQEETTGLGSKEAVDYIINHAAKLNIDPEKTMVIVGEPTGLDTYTIGNRGNAFVSITIYGKSCHGSTPERGRNAAEEASFLVQKLLPFTHNLQKTHKDPILGMPTIATTGLESNLSVVNGKIVPAKPNTIPNTAIITLDCRMGEPLFNENFTLFMRLLRKCVRESLREGFTADVEFLHAPVEGHVTDSEGRAARTLEKSIFDVFKREAKHDISTGANDAFFWGNASFDTINEYGPGDRHRNHVPDEWNSVKEMAKAVAMYMRIAEAWIMSF